MTLTQLKPYTKNLNLLVIEDDKLIRISTIAVFKRLFSIVDEAADGIEGLMMFQSHPKFYDLILTDINMPNMDGIEMIKIIRKDDALIPIVVLSAHTESDYLIEIINAGADCFLPKPLSTQAKIDSFYRLSIRISDAKLMREHIDQIEEENHLFSEELSVLREKSTLSYSVFKEITVPTYSSTMIEDQMLPLSSMVTNNSEDLKSVPTLTPTEASSTQSKQLHVYNYMDNEDLEDIKEHLSRLNSLLLIVGSGDITFEEVTEIAYYLERIGKSASIYPESYAIARALGMLSSSIQENLQTFIDKSSSLGSFCKTFGLDLHNWITLIFQDGATSVDVMDDTIISNSQMLGSMLTVTVSVNETVAMDDIFDF
ncbi:MAG: response regulator [Campylobacterales bacterium]|nr:response regulator [Campylobacterales bacterium]